MNEYDSNRIFDTVKEIGFVKTKNIDDANCYLLKTLSPNPDSTETSIPKSINFLATSGKIVARISLASSLGKNICIIIFDFESLSNDILKKKTCHEHRKFRS